MNTKCNYPGGQLDSGALAARRKAVGLSQQKLAHLADCSVAMISLLERGYQPENSSVLGRVVAAIDDCENSQEAA